MFNGGEIIVPVAVAVFVPEFGTINIFNGWKIVIPVVFTVFPSIFTTI